MIPAAFPIEASRQLTRLAAVFSVMPSPTWQALDRTGRRTLYAKLGRDLVVWSEDDQAWLALKPEMAVIPSAIGALMPPAPPPNGWRHRPSRVSDFDGFWRRVWRRLCGIFRQT